MKRALGSFLLWTFTITGLCWGGLAILGHWGVLTLAHPAGVVLHLLGGFGPTVGGLWVFCRGGGRLRQVPRLVFVPRRGTWWVVLLFCLAEGAVIALSSRQFNPQIPLSLVPVVFFQAALIYGGNEEVGWRGTMQPLLERAVPFPGAAVVTGLVWAVWHLPPVVCGGGLPADYPLRMVCGAGSAPEFLVRGALSQDPLGLWLQPGPWPDQYLALSVCHPGQRPFGGGVPAVAGGLSGPVVPNPLGGGPGGGRKGEKDGENVGKRDCPFPLHMVQFPAVSQD